MTDIGFVPVSVYFGKIMKKLLKTILVCISAIVILGVAQSIALVVGEVATNIGLPSAFEPVIDAILYPLLAYLGLKLLAGKFYKEYGIDKPRFKWYWILTAAILPAGMYLSYIAVGGNWVINDISSISKLVIALWSVLYYGFAAGIVEEMVFRGVIMGTISKNYNKIIAVVAPSVLFGVVHILGTELDVISMIQLVVAGTFVGIMFSLIDIQSESFWNNALVHAVWNMTLIGLWHINIEPDENALATLVINTKNTLISGGDFGIESSVIAIVGYVIVSLVALMLIKKEKEIGE